MNYIMVLLIFSSALLYFIIRLRQSSLEKRKGRIRMVVILSIVTAYLLLDFPFLLTGGIKKETDLSTVLGIGNRHSNTIALMKDNDNHLYWIGDITRIPPSKKRNFDNVKISYLPFTKSIAKVEHKIDINTASFLSKIDKRYRTQTDDGYFQIYTYWDDFLVTIIFLVIVFLTIGYDCYRKRN